MNSYGRFFVEFLTPFFEGLVLMFKSFFSGLLEMFNIVKYLDTITKYQDSVSMVFIIVAVICLLLLVALFAKNKRNTSNLPRKNVGKEKLDVYLFRKRGDHYLKKAGSR